MKRELILHIGTHKTGTTSIQKFLREEVGEPAFPRGLFFVPNSHAELMVLAGREQLHPQAVNPVIEQWLAPGNLARMRAEISARVASDVPRLVYSFEGLCLLRERAEFERLFELFAGREVHAVLYTREASAYLASYAATLGVMGRSLSPDPDSQFYVEPDSWLLDYSGRLALWRAYADRVTVLDYDHEVRERGSVVPSFAALLGMRPSGEYFLNRSSDLPTAARPPTPGTA